MSYNKILFIFLIFISYTKQLNNQDYENICLSKYNSIQNYFINLNDVTSSNDFMNQLKITKQFNETFISNIFIDGNFFSFLKFFIENKFHLIISFIIIITISIWVILIFNYCLEKYCFRKNNKYNIVGLFSLLLSLLCLLLMFISSIIMFFYIPKFIFYYSNSLCNALKFFYNFEKGNINNQNYFQKENYNYNNYNRTIFYGLNNIEQYLTETENLIELISTQKEKNFKNHIEINNILKKYENLINELPKEFYHEIPSPRQDDVEKEEKIYPIYLKEIENFDNKEIFLGKIYNINLEYKNNFDILNYIYENIIKIIQNKIEYIKNLEDAKFGLNNFNQLIKNYSEIFSDNLFKFYDYFIAIIYYSLYFLNYNFFIFCIILLILLPIYSFLNKRRIQKFLNIFWNYLFLLIILSFLLGSFLIFISNLSKDLIVFINENLNLDNNNNYTKIFDNIEMDSNSLKFNKNILNQCLNDNGDLSNILGLNNEFSLKLNEILEKFSQNVNNLKSIKKNTIIKQFIDYLNNFITDYSLSTNETIHKNSDINFLLNEITELTNNTDICNTNDIWVNSKRNCKNNLYLPKNEIENKIKGEKYCLIIQDKFDDFDLFNLYGNCIEDAYDKIATKIFGLTNFYINNLELLKLINEKLNELLNKDYYISSNLNEEIFNTKKLIKKLTVIYEPLQGNFLKMFNCNDLKYDLVIFYDQFYNYFIYYANILGKFLIFFGILALISNLCIIIIINKYSKEAINLYRRERNKEMNNEGDIELLENYDSSEEEKSSEN